MAAALYRGKSPRKPTARRTELSLAAPDLDLSTRLRQSHHALRSRVEHRDALLDIIRAVNSTLEPTEIATFIVERAAVWLPAPSWAVVGVDSSGQPRILADRALRPGMGSAIDGVASWVMQECAHLVTADLRADHRVPTQSVATVLAFPLTCRGRCVGALIGLDPLPSRRIPRLGPAMQHAIRTLLEPAAVALDNALLLKRAEALSVTDDLTSLYNSRYLNQVLRRETMRASRNGRPLSLLFIDLDGFKLVNDNHGHLFGSEALVEAAAVIRRSARETDVVARFGGDEFALVLPDTGGEGAWAAGERIRSRIEQYVFLTDRGLQLRLTVSIGVATLPDVASSAEELIHAADTAMYAVKDRGKNGTRAAAPPET